MTTVLEHEVVETLRELADRCPTPADWHPGAAAIRAAVADFRAAVAALEAGDAWPADEVEAARARLDALPRPEGRHPYMETIVPALEAAELALDLIRVR